MSAFVSKRWVRLHWIFLRSAVERTVVAGAVGKWESRVFCGIPKRSVFSTAFWCPRFLLPLLVGKESHPVRAVVHRQGTFQVLAHHHPASRQRAPPARALDLQNAVGQADGVVAVHHLLVLQRENALQVLPAGGHKSALLVRRPPPKPAAALRHVALPH